MIKCKNECPNEQVNFNGCCAVCPNRDSCEDACDKAPTNCGDSSTEAGNEETALIAFKETQLTVLNEIAALVTAKKDLEAKEADLKVQLQAAMEAHGIKKFESEILNITYIAATTENRIDSKKLKAKYPEIAAEVTNTNAKKAYIKIALKGEKEK